MAAHVPRIETSGRRSLWMRIRRLLGAIAGPLWPLEALPSPRAGEKPLTGLHECAACRRDMVCPLRWRPLGHGRWSITLRCGECGLARDFVATQRQAADFYDTFDRQQRKMERELGRLDAARMAEEVAAFIEALGRDLIDPADFAG
jgi:hypothetical protein